ncbi:MAG: MotA/TolQ/ExbB proton channel family protein [Chlamydiota bacterium]
MGTFSQAYLQADPFGKGIFFALFLLSCLSWVLLIRKLSMIRRAAASAKGFKRSAFLHKEGLLELKAEDENPLTVLYAVFKRQALIILEKNRYFADRDQHYLSKADIDFLDSQLDMTVMKLKGKIEKNLFILSTTTTLAPFLGLLGTVWGILISFGELQAGRSVMANGAILGGLSTALTTTVLGLLIAIPAVAGSHYLKSSIKNFTIEMIDFSHFLLSTLELQYRKVDVDR